MEGWLVKKSRVARNRIGCFALLCFVPPGASSKFQASNPITPFPACFFLSRLDGLVWAKETREMQRDKSPPGSFVGF